MPDPLSPHDIARRTFDVARRGYEQQEVRGFLHEVSGLVERLRREETELRERVARAENRLAMAERPDEATLIEVLGEETTRVLTSARESAAEIRAKAEEAAARMIEEATSQAAAVRSEATEVADAALAEARAEAERLLEQARTELDRRRGEAEAVAGRIRAAAESEAEALRESGRADGERARAEGEADREAARREGRQMVLEAQAVRERVLRDLATRRKRARIQVEKLSAGRERLLEAYEVVRRTVEEATTELSRSLVDARLAGDTAARRIDEEPEPTLEQLDEEVADAGLGDLPIADVPDGPGEGPGHDEDGGGPGPSSPQAPTGGGGQPEREPVEPAPAVADAPAPTELDPPVGGQGAPEEASEPTGAAPAAAPQGPRVIELDHGRGRRRRRKGFEGLPPAPLTVVEPPSDGEAVRILAEPSAAAPGGSEGAGTAGTADPAATGDVAEDQTAEAPSDAPLGHEVATAGAGAAVEPGAELGAPGPGDDGEPGADEAAQVEPGAEVTATDEGPAAPAGEPVEAEGPAAPAGEPVEAEGPHVEADAEGPHVEAGATESRAADVFARLRAEQGSGAGPAAPRPAEGAEAEPSLVEGAPPGSASTGEGAEGDGPGAAGDAGGEGARPFRARASALESIEKDLARRLKRVLADEQNEVLDLLRRAKPKGPDDLLPDPAAHAARWSDAARAPLSDAVEAGADWSGGRASSATDLAEDLGRTLTAPLRERVERSFAAADGNLDEVADRVRALYREWKGQRLSEAVADAAAAGYARGVLDGVPSGGAVRWVVDPSAGPCPDCDDNVLAGVQVKGEPFPTGGANAPAHPGCHCLVLPADA